MTSIEAAKIIATLIAAYPRVDISEETTKLYAKFLQDLDYHQVQAAVVKHIATSPYFPTIAELRQAAVDVIPDSNIPLPGEAWAEVTKHMRDVGYTGKPTFSHPLIEKTIQAMGGWIALCQSEDGMVDRAHFMKIYESYRNRHVEEVKTAPVMMMLVGDVVKSLPELN